MQDAPTHKLFFDWETARVAALGAIGGGASTFNSIVGTLISLLTLALLAHKAWRVFVKREKE